MGILMLWEALSPSPVYLDMTGEREAGSNLSPKRQLELPNDANVHGPRLQSYLISLRPRDRPRMLASCCEPLLRSAPIAELSLPIAKLALHSFPRHSCIRSNSEQHLDLAILDHDNMVAVLGLHLLV